MLSDWKRMFELDQGVLLDENDDSEAKAAVVLTLITGIARLLRKEVILGAEYVSFDARQLRDLAVCIADSSGNPSLGDVERERVRCGL